MLDNLTLPNKKKITQFFVLSRKLVILKFLGSIFHILTQFNKEFLDEDHPLLDFKTIFRNCYSYIKFNSLTTTSVLTYFVQIVW